MNKKAVKKWINHTISALLLITILLLMYFVVSSKISGGNPKVFGKTFLSVLSGSMEPSILTGSIIAITPANGQESYKVGDIVTYRALDNPNMLITHRIKDIQKHDSTIQYITKGDNNDSNDPSPIPVTNIVGKYTGFTFPWIGYVYSFIKSKMGVVLLFIVPGFLLVCSSIVSLWKTILKIEKSKPGF